MEKPVAPTERSIPSTPKQEFGPILRALASRYFGGVRFAPEAAEELRRLGERGLVVHVMRASSWVNFLYLAWALVQFGLPPIRAIVNLRPWFTRPWRRAAQRGDVGVRIGYARRQKGSALIFLSSPWLANSGKGHHEDPFLSMVSLAQRSRRPVYLVPELFVWKARSASIRPSLWDRIFGSSEAPGFLHSILAFWRNRNRAQFRVGEPIDLTQFLAANPHDTDARLARKVRSSLHHHLSREARAVFGPPLKSTERLIQETLRDRNLRRTLNQISLQSGRSEALLLRDAHRHLRSMAARLSPTLLTLASRILTACFRRIYEGIEVDEAGLERALKAARKGPMVLCPGHKSHMDYLMLSWVLWVRGYNVPLVAAGANLSFFPLGAIFRRLGAFFIRRSFKGDEVYTSTFRAYLKKLISDGLHQEFFIEGGRSRTGKLLPPKLGMLSWQVESVLEGTHRDLIFVPIAIDYEKIIEFRSYSRELRGADKTPESMVSLLKLPKVLARKFGRIHLSFGEPLSLAAILRERGHPLTEPLSEDAKRPLVLALAHRIMFGIHRASTVMPQGVTSAALLSSRHRGITESDIAWRCQLILQIAQMDGARLSPALRTEDATLALQAALELFIADGLVTRERIRADTIFQPVEVGRTDLAYYRNTMVNLMAPYSIVAIAVRSGGERGAKERALELSRLLKMELVYQSKATFDELFEQAMGSLYRLGIATSSADPKLDFLAELLRDYVEAYWVAARTLEELLKMGSMDRKSFVKASMEMGRMALLSGQISRPEALSRATLDNAASYFVDRGVLVETRDKLALAEGHASPAKLEEIQSAIHAHLQQGPP